MEIKKFEEEINKLKVKETISELELFKLTQKNQLIEMLNKIRLNQFL